jgi:AAA domain
MLLHGEPRARKSLAAFELALAAATGTAPFGLERFTPSAPIGVLYVQEEDPRALTRARLRRLVQERCGNCPPATLHVAVRRGVDLDDPLWIARLIADLKRLGAKLLVLDAARRLSAKTDEGPAKVRELIAALRAIVTAADVTIVVVHHDIKPPQTGQDQRRRSQRASGGDWFAGCECPVHVEKIGALESLIFPEDYKFAADPAPFTFTCAIADGLVARLVGIDTTTDHAERAGIRGKVLEWLRANGPATKTDMKKAGLGQWPAIEAALTQLMKEGKVDSAPGRKAGSLRFFVGGESSNGNLDGSTGGAHRDA